MIMAGGRNVEHLGMLAQEISRTFQILSEGVNEQASSTEELASM